MNKYTITVDFNVKAENEEQAKKIVTYEVQEKIRFKGVPYAENDSGIIEFLNHGIYFKK
jgi:hypothetical protein